MPHYTAIGDGACLFNSISLQLYHYLIIQKQVSFQPNERFQAFLDTFARVTGNPATLTGLVSFIEKESKPSLINLQRTLSPIIREFTVSGLYDDGYYTDETTLAALTAELRDFLFSQHKIPSQKPGDIFRRCPNIIKAFKVVNEKFLKNFNWQGYQHALRTQSEQLAHYEERLAGEGQRIIDWYRDEGYKHFLQHMLSPFTDAGDIELAYFMQGLDHVTTLIHRGNNALTYAVTSGHGKLNIQSFSESDIQTLYDMKIIATARANNDGEVELLKIPAHTLKAAHADCQKKINLLSNSEAIYASWSAAYCHEPLIWHFRNDAAHWNPEIPNAKPAASQSTFFKNTPLTDIIRAAAEPQKPVENPLHLMVKANKILESYLDKGDENPREFEILFNTLEDAVAQNDHQRVARLAQRFK